MTGHAAGDSLRLRMPAPGTQTVNGDTLPAQIYARLEEAIIRGDVAPNSRLLVDKIAAQYGVSRIPVREALRALHEAGWVEIRPRYGVYVRERSTTEVHELFEARSGIEAQIAALAARRRSDEDMRTVRAIVRVGRAALAENDAHALSEASVAFNQALRRASRNSVLATLAATLEKRARFYFSMVEDRFGADWVTIEQALLASIEHGDAERAAQIAREHILGTGAAVLALLDETQ